MPRVIDARTLTKRFGATAAVDAVDLDVVQGEIFGLVGPNGAGKTTLLQLLAALLDPSAGSAVVLGCDVLRDAAALRTRIGYVSQEFTLYGTLTVEENLEFFADLYRVPSAVREPRKEELLAWSRLAPFRHRRAGRLSGGMQKKLHRCPERKRRGCGVGAQDTVPLASAAPAQEIRDPHAVQPHGGPSPHLGA